MTQNMRQKHEKASPHLMNILLLSSGLRETITFESRTPQGPNHRYMIRQRLWSYNRYISELYTDNIYYAAGHILCVYSGSQTSYALLWLRESACFKWAIQQGTYPPEEQQYLPHQLNVLTLTRPKPGLQGQVPSSG